jgi:hypothetical protein
MRSTGVKMGGGQAISIFLKGNDDLADALLATREGGKKLAKGLRERVNEIYESRIEIKISQEASGPTELLLLSRSSERASLSGSQRSPELMSQGAQSRLFEQPWDVVVFSLEPEVTHSVWVHRESGFRIALPPGADCGWSSDQKRFFLEQYEPQGLVPVERFREYFARFVADIKQRLPAHIIVFNCFAFDPHDRTRNYYGVQDTIALRALKFNLALIDISTEEGISIIDVDRVVAELGGASHVSAAFRYSARACELIRDEFLRVLQDIGFFERRPLVKQVGTKGR